MKAKFVILSLLLVSAASSFAADGPMVPIDLNARWSELSVLPRNDHPKNWGVNSKFSGGEVKLVMSDGGGALELRSTDAEGKSFHVFNRDVFIKTAPGSVVNVKVLARGKGMMEITGYLYDAASDSLGSAASSAIELNADNFSELEYRIAVPQVVGRKAAPAQMRIAISLSPGAEVSIKSIEAETNHPQ